MGAVISAQFIKVALMLRGIANSDYGAGALPGIFLKSLGWHSLGESYFVT